MAVIADVHTDSNSEQVLEEAVGNPYHLYVIVPVDGVLTLTGRGVQLLRVQAAHGRPPDRRGLAVHAGLGHGAGAAGMDKELPRLIFSISRLPLNIYATVTN